MYLMKKMLSMSLAVLFLLAAVVPPAAAEGKVLRFATQTLGGVFNPALCADVYDGYVAGLLFSTLCAADPENNIIFNENTVADGYELSEDHLTYTFHLKEGLLFSNGDALTASDVKFTYQMMAHPDYDGPYAQSVADMVGYAAYKNAEAEDFAGIRVIDDQTIAFDLSVPYVGKLNEFAVYGILCEEVYGAAEDYQAFKALNAAPVGSGPFTLSSYTPGQSAILEQNPKWFGQKPKLDGVAFLMIPSETQTMALIGGECDLIEVMPDQDTYDTLAGLDMNVLTFLSLGYNSIMLNCQSPKLNDVNVRKALMMGFDRQAFIDNQFDGFAKPCLTTIYPEFWAYPKDDAALDAYAFDPETACGLLEGAGWSDTDGDGVRDKDGVELELTLYIYPESDWTVNLAALLSEQWSEIGVGLSVISGDFNTIMAQVYDERAFDKFDMWTQGARMSGDPDMTEVLSKAAYEAKGGYNAGGYINEKSDALMLKARQEFDQEKRAAIYAEWAVLINDTLPMLFGATRDEMWASAPNVTGLDRISPFYPWTRSIFDIDL